MIRKLFKKLTRFFSSDEKHPNPEKDDITKEPKVQIKQPTAEVPPAQSPEKDDRVKPLSPKGENTHQQARKEKPVPRPRPKKPQWTPDKFKVEPEEGKTRFHDLKLPDRLMHGIADLKFPYCTPIQAAILPEALKGIDITGRAQTGTGKSAAFLTAIIARLMDNPVKGKRPNGTPRALILAPTRELALQIEKDARDLSKYTWLRILSVFGGMGYEKQKSTLSNQVVDIIMATPGRLLDFQKQKLLKLHQAEILVLDEADRMLDMGFIPDVRRIIHSTPNKSNRQTMFFSATLTPEITRLADQWTKDPFNAEIMPDQVASDSVKQIVYLVTSNEKFPLLYNLITAKKLERVIVFVNRRDQTRNLADQLERRNIKCAILSGEVPQNKRLRALEDFRSGKITVMVATDVAARGIHIKDISHVINYYLPQDPDHYVHRIGRTGRAGADGTSISFADEHDSFCIPDIEEFLGNKLECEYPEDDQLITPPAPSRKKEPPKKKAYQKPRPKGQDNRGKRSGSGGRPSDKRGNTSKSSTSNRKPYRKKSSAPPKKSNKPSSDS